MTQPAHTHPEDDDAHWRRIVFGTALAVFDAATTPATPPAASASPHESTRGGGPS